MKLLNYSHFIPKVDLLNEELDISSDYLIILISVKVNFHLDSLFFKNFLTLLV